MTDTDTNMLAKTVGPGASPSSTTTGSAEGTVLNATKLDVSERCETMNSFGPEEWPAHGRIGGTEP